MTTTLTIKLDEHTKLKSANELLNMHWTQRQKLNQQQAHTFKQQLPPHLQNLTKTHHPGPIHITYTRILGPHEKQHDIDNLATALKHIQDQLHTNNITTNDNPNTLKSATYKQDPNQRHNGPAIHIQITTTE